MSKAASTAGKKLQNWLTKAFYVLPALLSGLASIESVLDAPKPSASLGLGDLGTPFGTAVPVGPQTCIKFL